MSSSDENSEWGEAREQHRRGVVTTVHGADIGTYDPGVRPVTFLNPANGGLTHGGGVARALRDRYPEEMDQDRENRERLLPLPNGNYSVLVPDGEVLNVVYARNAGWAVPQQQEYLYRVVESALLQARNRVVVTTLFGDGYYGYDTGAAIRAMNAALERTDRDVHLLLPARGQPPQEGEGASGPDPGPEREEGEQQGRGAGQAMVGTVPEGDGQSSPEEEAGPSHSNRPTPAGRRVGFPGAQPTRMQALNEESTDEESEEGQQEPDRIFARLWAKGNLLPVEGPKGPIENHWFLECPLGKIPQGPLHVLQPVGKVMSLDTAALLSLKARHRALEGDLRRALAYLRDNPHKGEVIVRGSPRLGGVLLMRIDNGVPRDMAPEAGAMAERHGLCIVNLRARRIGATPWQTILAGLMSGLQPTENGQVVILVPSAEDAEETAGNPEDWDESEQGQTPGPPGGKRRKNKPPLPPPPPREGAARQAPVQGTNARSRAITRRRLNPRARPCKGPIRGTDEHPFTPYAGDGPTEPFPDWDSRPHDWYDADEASIRGAEQGPSADQVYDMPGVTKPWKEEYLAAGYDYYKGQVKRRDRSVEERMRRSQQQMPPQSPPRTPSPSPPPPPFRPHRPEPRRPQTPFRPIDGGFTPENPRQRLRYDAPLFTPGTSGAAPESSRDKLVRMMTPGAVPPQEDVLPDDPEWGIQLRDVIPQREKEESDADYLHRAALALGGPDRLDRTAVSMFITSQRGVIRPAGMLLSDVLALRVRPIGQSDMKEKMRKALADVKSGKLPLATALASLTAEGIQLHQAEEFLLDLKGTTQMAARWEYMNPRERIEACCEWDRVGAAHRALSRARAAQVERPYTRSQALRPEQRDEQRGQQDTPRRDTPPQGSGSRGQTEGQRTGRPKPRPPQSGDGNGPQRPPRPRVSDEEWNRMSQEDKNDLNRKRREWDKKYEPARYEATQKKWEARKAQQSQKGPRASPQ